MKPWIVRFTEENGRLLAVVDALAIPNAKEVEAAGGWLIAETLKERSRLGLERVILLEEEPTLDETDHN
ncbi:MAG TPA: hypothetical protein VGX03_36120 [Candidatus Binatia bacterium]|jgi:hypothetical protein|nr:hypothetical protein [Candidatus Binatia bacterium]